MHILLGAKLSFAPMALQLICFIDSFSSCTDLLWKSRHCGFFSACDRTDLLEEVVRSYVGGVWSYTWAWNVWFHGWSISESRTFGRSWEFDWWYAHLRIMFYVGYITSNWKSLLRSIIPCKKLFIQQVGFPPQHPLILDTNPTITGLSARLGYMADCWSSRRPFNPQR